MQDTRASFPTMCRQGDTDAPSPKIRRNGTSRPAFCFTTAGSQPKSGLPAMRRGAAMPRGAEAVREPPPLHFLARPAFSGFGGKPPPNCFFMPCSISAGDTSRVWEARFHAWPNGSMR
jgi:hypothetical protein